MLVYSTGFVLNEEDDSGDAALLTRQKSTGSGVIVSADGYVVTNAHVVKGSRHIQVQLSDWVDTPPGHSVVDPSGKKVDAKIVGLDRDSDLAVFEIRSRRACRSCSSGIPRNCSKGRWCWRSAIRWALRIP